ncbi:MAG TPA: PD-(D/E)XK nuclease family protein [Acidimicrobiales bacterium]|nr:PD-(D/E)XK nuclease family protein [Acidimicrobiales bacterium]
MPGSTSTDAADVALAGLGRILADIKGDDPLAPVTVLAPSGYAAVFVRRSLGSLPGPGARRGWVNVGCTTTNGLLQMLGSPPLAERGLRLVSPAADLEVIGAQLRASPGWLGRFASHPTAPTALQRTLTELRGCPPVTLDALTRHGGHGADLVDLLGAVRQALHDCGLADIADLRAEAVDQARRQPSSVRALGPVVSWHLRPEGPAERELLAILGARPLEATGSGNGTIALTEIRPHADPDEEGRSAVRSIVAAAEAGVPLWQQAVFHPPGPTYPRILFHHLTAAGVASNGPEHRRLHRSMTGRILLGLLDLAAGDWPRDQVMAWLSAGPLTQGPAGAPVPAGRWDVVSAAAGVVRGPGQWSERLGRVAAGGGPSAADAGALAAFVRDLIGRAAPPAHSWRAFTTWAVALLDHYLRPDAGADPWPVEERAAARQVRAAVADLGDLDHVSRSVDLASFRRAVVTQLESRVLDTQELSDGGVGDGVYLAPYSGARGLSFHTAVVTGLVEAFVPGNGDDQGILSDDLCRLDTSGALRTRADRRAERRDDLVTAVAAGLSARIGTLPRGDPRSGRAQVPSRWMGDLVDDATSWRPVDSFAAGLADAEPALSVREFELRELDRWVGDGRHPSLAPLARAGRLARGFACAEGRSDTRFTRYDGWVGAGRVSAFDPGTPVSATRFETYAKCPRRFLLDRVLHVSERVRPEELWRIEPMTRGSLVHAILETYVAERVQGAARSLHRLLAIAAEQLDEAETGGLVGKSLLWRLDRSAIVRDLTRFHAEEGSIEPIAAELSFGVDDDDAEPPVSVVLDDGRSVAFRGSVDRVDRTTGGQLMVSDYKTGKQGRLSELIRDPVAAGKLLQLPLYAMAAWERFGGPRPVHARYWLLSGERSTPCFHLVVTPVVEARFRQVVRLIADGVEDGCFPAVPGAPTFRSFSNCMGCDFDSVCPAGRDRQWGRKYNQPQLRSVVTLVNSDVPDELAGSVVKRFVDPDSAAGP